MNSTYKIWSECVCLSHVLLQFQKKEVEELGGNFYAEVLLGKEFHVEGTRAHAGDIIAMPVTAPAGLLKNFEYFLW